MNIFNTDILNLITEFFFISIITILLGLSIYIKNNYTPKQTLFSITDISLICLFFGFILNIYTNFITDFSANYLFEQNTLTNFLKMILLIVSITTFTIAKSFLKNKEVLSFEIPIILLFSILGIIIVLTSNDLIMLYLGLEMQSLSIYALVASKYNSNISTEAGLKYFILGSFISGFILYSISLIYIFTGTTNLSNISILINIIPNNNLIKLSIILLSISLLFKLSAAPFHSWTPDVFEGSPTIITLFIATAPKLIIVYILINLYCTIFNNLTHYWIVILTFSGILSLIIGTFGGLYQIKIKRLLAYSTINNVGFILIALSLGNQKSIEIVLFFMLIYLLLTTGIFATLISNIKTKNNLELTYINDLTTIYNVNSTIAILMAINIFSLIGIPPLAGFISKFYLLIFLMQNHTYAFALIIIVASVLSSFYYVRLVKIIFYSKNLWIGVYNKLHEHITFIIYTINIINILLILNSDYILNTLNIISFKLYM